MPYPLRNLLIAGQVARQKAALLADSLQSRPLDRVRGIRRMAAGALLLKDLSAPRLLRRPLRGGLGGR